MATATFNSFNDNSTDANFRAWGSALSAALASVGLVQTTDTGQINWATVTHPTAINTYQGYEIWRLNDVLQAAAPFFFKIEYGSANPSTNPSIRVTTATGSNGAGVLTNPVGPCTFSTTASQTASQWTSYVCGDSAGFGLALWAGSSLTTTSIFLFYERSKDQSGNDTNTYLCCAWSSPSAFEPLDGSTIVGSMAYVHISNTNQSVFDQRIANISGFLFTGIPGLFTMQASTTGGGNIALIPIQFCYGYFNYPLRRAICGKFNDWVAGDTPSISLYPGVTDSYRVFKQGGLGSTGSGVSFGPCGYCSPGSSSFGQYVVIMRWQ